jgi:hypothetical protein
VNSQPISHSNPFDVCCSIRIFSMMTLTAV